MCVVVGCRYCKNWTFARESLEVMCGMGLKGVLIATQDKTGTNYCKIPKNCDGALPAPSLPTAF